MEDRSAVWLVEKIRVGMPMFMSGEENKRGPSNRRSYLPDINQRASGLLAAAEKRVRSDPYSSRLGLCCGKQLLRFFDRDSERLFRINMFSCFYSTKRNRAMALGNRQV